MMLRAVILGCGSSGGVPRPGGSDGLGQWGRCDPQNPKNRRKRCSLLVQRAHAELGWDTDQLTTILVDTSPDLREQLLLARCTHIDGVLFTHEHADQSHGIDDLRVMALTNMKRVPTYVDEATSGQLLKRFSYCFTQADGSYYPAILEHKTMPKVGEWGQVDGPSGPIDFMPFLQHHGNVDSLGFKFGKENSIAYSSDVVDIPEESFDTLANINTWIVDALRYEPHISHAHLIKTLSWIKSTTPQNAILTNLHIDMDYEEVQSSTPQNVSPAYDGLMIEVDIPTER